MKRIISLLIICLTISTISAQKNYPIVSLEDCTLFTLINDEPLGFAIFNDEQPYFALYDIEKKEIVQKFKSTVPSNKVAYLLPCDNGLLYIITTKRIGENKMPFLDAIYSFCYKKDKVVKVYEEKEKVVLPRSAEMAREKMYLTSNPYKKQPLVFDVKSNQFESFSDNKDLRMLFASDRKNAKVVMDLTKMEDEEAIPVFVLDLDNVLSEQVGTYNSSMVLSSEKDENKMPGFTISNSDYQWIVDEYGYSGFPHSGFSIATRKGLAENYNAIENMFDIRELWSANSDYLVASGKGKVFIYNTKNPQTSKPKTVNDDEIKAITDYYAQKTTYTKSVLPSQALSTVFGRTFYAVNERFQCDEYSYEESNFIAYAIGDKCEVLKDKKQLEGIIATTYKVKEEKDALVFQDALNALYPPGTFAKKHIQCYKNANQWMFIRDESFGKKEGFIVEVNESGEVLGVNYSKEII